MKSFIAALMISAALTTGAAAQIGVDKPIVLGGGQTGSANFSANAAIGRVMSQIGNMNVRVQSYGGVGNYLPFINNGELDFAAITLPAVLDAMTGTGSFEGRKQENIRLVARLVPQLVGMFVKKDSPIRSVADLKGKRVTAGLIAQPTQVNQLLSMLANAGLSESDVVEIPAPTIVRGVDDFVAGRTDAGFFSLGGGRLLEADTQLGGIRFLQLNDAPAAVAAMRKFTPGAYVVRLEPRPNQVGIAEPTNVLAYDYVFIAGTHVPDAIVGQILKLLAANEKALAESAPVMHDFKGNEMAKDLEGLAYHPGAIKYYQGVGQWPPKQD